MALAGQPAPDWPDDDGPLATAPRERPASQVPAGPPPAAAAPASEDKSAPAAVAAARTLSFEPRTLVDGDTLQILRGQRALFRLDDKGLPVLTKVEEGKLADAHPPGAVTETFAAPPPGQIAAALDASAEKRAAVLKVWNQGSKPIDYRAVALVYRGGKLTPVPVAVCAVPPRSVRIETWRAPIVAVGLARFKETATTKACQ